MPVHWPGGPFMAGGAREPSGSPVPWFRYANRAPFVTPIGVEGGELHKPRSAL